MKASTLMFAALLATAAGAAVAPLMAQSPPSAMTGMEPNGDKGPSSQAFAQAMDKMQKDMSISYTGNADIDFVNGMMPHHQGAIDMAKVELQYGKDPQMLKMAKMIVAAQEKEIGEMKAWLAKKGK